MKSIRILAIIIALTGLVPTGKSQVITSLTPNSGTIGKTVDVLIRGVGTHFSNNGSVASFGQGIVVQKLYVSNPLTATATVLVTGSAAAGFRDVTIKTGSESAIAFGAFEVFTATGNLRANIDVLPVETISLADLDLTKPLNTPILFFVNIYNDNVKRIITIDVSLSSVSRGYIGKLSRSRREIAANSFTRITNRDFTKVDINGPGGNEFLAIVKSIGTFPPDDYTYKMEILDENGQVIATDEVVNVVTNFNYNPELIYPGSDFTGSIETIFTQFPLFQWFGQMDKYDFYLFELRDGQTPQEAIRNIAVYQQKDVTATSLIYPAYAEKLIDGKMYAWYVNGKIATAKGEQSLPSQPFRFIYNKTGGSSTSGTGSVAKIEISPDETDLGANEKLQFNAVFLDSAGNPVLNIKPIWNVTPNKGTITQQGLYTAGSEGGPVAIVVKVGDVTEYAIVNINAKTELPDTGGWLIDMMLKQLFGLP